MNFTIVPTHSGDTRRILLFKSKRDISDFMAHIQRDPSAVACLELSGTDANYTEVLAVTPLDDDKMVNLVNGLFHAPLDQSGCHSGDNAIVALGFPAAYPLSKELWRSQSEELDKRILRLIYKIAMQCDDPRDVDAIIGELEFAMKTGQKKTVNEALGQMIDQVRKDLLCRPITGSM